MHLNRKTIKSKGSYKTRFTQVYNTILKSKEWMIVNCVVNAIRTTLPGFYKFKGERIRDYYI
jgi:wobble nucleotide-excising tRNase